eukprot:Lankesteria_metandrocarpae@DN5317_c0_g1_i2.p1
MKFVVLFIVFVVDVAWSQNRTFADDYLSCQCPTAYLRLMHQVDYSTSNADFLTLMKGGVFDRFDSWLRDVFEVGVASGLGKFTNKKERTGNVIDSCYTSVTPMQTTTVSNDFNAIVANGSDPDEGRSIMDVLIAAAQMDWETVSIHGHRVVYVYSSCVPDLE